MTLEYENKPPISSKCNIEDIEKMAFEQVYESLGLETKILWGTHTGALVTVENTPLNEKTVRSLWKIYQRLVDSEGWPWFRAYHLREVIESEVGSDPRTVDRYIEYLKMYMITETGSTPSHNWNLEGLGIALQKAILKNKQGQKIKEALRNERANDRPWCKRCHSHVRKDGGCRC